MSISLFWILGTRTAWPFRGPFWPHPFVYLYLLIFLHWASALRFCISKLPYLQYGVWTIIPCLKFGGRRLLANNHCLARRLTAITLNEFSLPSHFSLNRQAPKDNWYFPYLAFFLFRWTFNLAFVSHTFQIVLWLLKSFYQLLPFSSALGAAFTNNCALLLVATFAFLIRCYFCINNFPMLPASTTSRCYPHLHQQTAHYYPHNKLPFPSLSVSVFSAFVNSRVREFESSTTKYRTTPDPMLSTPASTIFHLLLSLP